MPLPVSPLPDVRLPDDEPPPFLGTWKRVYTAVLCYLVILILVLYAITRLFTY